MIRRIHYGSQIYIEINNLKPLPNAEKRLLCSSGFLQESVHAVKSSNFHHANFRNCLFVILPGLVDTTEDLHIVQSLRTQLEYLVAYEKEDKGTKDQKEKKEYKSGKHYVNSQLDIKTKHIEQKEKHIKDLNKKIMEEMDNKPVNFADVVLLKHLESGYYLCADFAHHPHDHSLNNLHLQKELSLGCYFKFFSYTSANERGPFYHYESEMKLVSAYTNGIVTMAKSHPENHLEFYNEDDLNRDLDEQGFPKDMARRKDVIQSFDNRNTNDRENPSADFIVGTTSESADDNRIRVYNFVTRTELLDYAKRRAIKNGDYVRLHIDEFYLTAYKNPNRELIGLFSQMTENYSYNMVNSIFQVIKAGEVASHVYPVGHEIQTEPKEADDAHLAEGGVFLKHFVTGAYLPAFNKSDKLEKLFVYDPERDEEVPWFGLMNSHLKGHAETLTRNSKVNLKVFGKESCLESEIENELKKIVSKQYNQKDPENGPLGGYSGHDNPEDKIARHLRLGRKAITRKGGFDSFFRVNLVNDEEIQRIQEFESYAASLRKFMFCVLKRIYDENASINLQAELTKIIEHTKKLRELVQAFDMQSQVLCMELKIVDVAAQLIYFFYGGIGASATLKASLNGKEIVSLIKDLTEIIVSSIDGNSFIHSYMSQYVKVFISCLLHFPEVMTKEVDQVKNAVVKLLRRFLSEKDATTLQLFDNYARKILEKAYKQSDYSTHLLRIMDHNSSSKAVNVTNNLRDTFIKTYLSDDKKRRRILPPLTLSSDNQIQIVFETEDNSETILFHKANSEQLMYMKWVFRLINTIAKRQPLRFLIRIIEHYDGTLLLRLIESNRTQLGLKAEILGALRSVHFAYVKLPFNLLDSRIHYLKFEPDHELESMKTDFEQSCIQDLKKDGIDTHKIEQLIDMKFNFETVFVKLLADHLLELFPPNNNVTISDFGTGSLLEIPSPVKPRTPNTANESALPLLDHTTTRNLSYPSAELKPPKKSKTLEEKTIAFLGSTLQLIDDVLHNREDIGLETVCQIKKFLCTLVEEAAKGLQVLESSYGKVFNRYAHKIFKSLVEIDKFVLNLAFKDYLKTHHDIKVKKSPKDDSQGKKKKNQTSKINPVKKLRKATTIVHVQRGLEWIPEGFANLKFLKEWLKKDDSNHKGAHYASIQSLDEGLLKALWKIVKIGEESLSNAAVIAMESRSSLNKIYQEIYDYTFLSGDSEVATLTQLMEHLLNLTTIGRRFQVKMGFQLKTKEGPDTINKIIELFENILLIIYPFADIMRKEDPSLEPEEARKQYFKRFRESKLQPQEMPFVMDPKLIKTFYQKVLKILKAPKILAPFIRFLGNKKNRPFAEFEEQDARYAYYLVIAIFRIFMQDRLDNQLILAELADIIALFHDKEVMNQTVEASEMFKELCKNADIFKRLTGSQDFDFLTSYISNIQSFSFEDKMEYVSLRNLNNVLSLEFAKDLVRPGPDQQILMQKKLEELFQYLANENKISLVEILRHNEWLVLSGGYDSEREPLYHDNIQIEFPSSRIVIKELLEAESHFAKTASKAEVIILQKAFMEGKITSLLTNRSIEFNFDIKQKVLEFFENLNFKSTHKRTSVFLNYEQFAKFVTILFVDVQEYLITNSRDPKLKREFFGQDASNLKRAQGLRTNYGQLPKGKLNNLAFMEYQSLVLFRHVWKDYIYYVLCNLFGTFISNYSGFMKDSQQTYFAESIFKIWFRLLRKLFHVDKLFEEEATDKYRMMIQKALKDAAEYAEYAEYRKKIERKMGKMAAEKQDTKEKATLSNAMDIDLAGTNVAGKSLKNCDGHEEKDDEYIDKRLEVFYRSLENGGEVIQKLCKLLAAPETARKDKLFLLAFFAQTMKKKKKKKKDEKEDKDDKPDKPVETEKMKAEKILAEKKWAAKVLETQDMLAELGIVDALFEVLLQHEDDKRVFTKVIALSAALLKGGNRKVQDKFYQCFKTDFDNQVFSYITNFLETIFESFLVNEKERTQICYRRALNFVFDYLIKNKLSIGMVVASGDVKEMLEKAYQNEIEKELDSTVMAESASIQKDRKLLKLILKFIHYLCEGHHPEFQEFLRDQTLENHTHSYNLLEFLLQTYRVYHKHINTHNLDIGIKILEAIIEMEQSEIPTNTLMLLNKTFINDICATVNIHHVELDLLSRGFSFDPNAGEFLVLKLKALTILKDLVEKLDLPDLKKMKQYIDLPLLIGPLKENILKFDYDKRQDDKKIRSPKDLEEEDIVNENLSCASMIYIILRHLSFDEGEETFSQDIHNAIQQSLEGHKEAGIVRRYLNHFFKEYIGTIEIFRPKSTTLVKIYFPTPVMYFYLKDERKNEFCGAVDRSSTQTKITALMDSIDEFKSEMKLEYDPKTLHHRLPLNVNTIFYYMIYLTAFLALTVNVFNVFTLEYNYDTGDVDYKISDRDHRIMLGLNITQSILSFLLLARWLSVQRATYLTAKWSNFVKSNSKKYGPLLPDLVKPTKESYSQFGGIWKNVSRLRKKLRLKGPDSPEWQNEPQDSFLVKAVLMAYNLNFIFRCWEFWSLSIYFGVCVGSNFHPLVTTVQLFDIALKSDVVIRIIRAFFKNIFQFMWTVFLLIIAINTYTMIGMHFLHNRYEDGDGGDLCPDAYACFLANLNYGLRNGGGIADSLQGTTYNPHAKWNYYLETFFDLSFFIGMITLLLNLVFGMIIDAFGDLRDEKTFNDDDIANVCFICGLQRSEYERSANFDRHIEEEHNMWQYVAYIVYLLEKEDKDPEELNDIEDYVLNCYKEEGLKSKWIPMGKSLTLQRLSVVPEEEETGEEQEKFKEMLTEVVDKVVKKHNRYLLTKVSKIHSVLSDDESKIFSKKNV